MMPDMGTSDRELFVAVFSDDPLPDIEAAIVVAHPGDEAISASWLMARLQERTSVYCLTKAANACPGGLSREAPASDAMAANAATVACAALAGVPYDRCHNLGLIETDLARDLEALVWLTTAAVSTLKPRVLVTHSCEGKSLDHDATCLAVHVTARLMTRYGAAAPLVVEFPRHGELAGKAEPLSSANARQAVRIEFGPESRKVKRRMLQCHAEGASSINAGMLQNESYVLAAAGNPFDAVPEAAGSYLDAPWCPVDAFRRQAGEVLASFNRAVLSSPSQA